MEKEEVEEKAVEESDMPSLAKKDEHSGVSFQYNYPTKKSHKGLYLIIIILLGILAAGFFFRSKVKRLVMGGSPTPTPVATEIPTPTSTPNPLNRSDWSFEVLNGSGESGLAKKIGGQLQDLGYQVVKTGNAPKSNYTQTQILVRQDQMEKVDLVIADLKDTIKIATVAGELKEGTASARIIIGKDSI